MKKQAVYITNKHCSFWLCHFSIAWGSTSISAGELITVGCIFFPEKNPTFFAHCSEIPFVFRMLAWDQISHLSDQKSCSSGHCSFWSARASTFSVNNLWKHAERHKQVTAYSWHSGDIQHQTSQCHVYCTLLSCTHKGAGSISLVKIKIHGQKGVGTGPSSKEISHFLFSLHYGSSPTEITGFPGKESLVNYTWGAQPRGSLATTSYALLTTSLHQEHWIDKKDQMAHVAIKWFT